MAAVVFVGPTLPADEVSRCLEATILPPVRQGDVYRAVKDKPSAIGIIDGFFEGVPSVWHKEILWAMEQGIPVYGSASMGALRAAELADFGMIGVGRIFRDYLSGVLQDDDEVAVLHSPAELGFQPLSEPMVSVRATIENAEETGVITPEQAAEILHIAKALPYKERIWSRICAALGSPDFTDWLAEGKIDAKAEDAREMLALMARSDTPDRINEIGVRVEPTLAWRELRARIDRDIASAKPMDKGIVDELRLTPDRYSALRDRALLNCLATDEAHRINHQPGRDDLVELVAAHRAQARLPRQADLVKWLEKNDLAPQDYESMLADQSRLLAVTAARADTLDPTILANLRQTGDYPDLRDRVQRKAAELADQPARKGPSLDRLQVLIWYFETRLDQPVPDDLESYARSLGLAGRDAFYELIEAEFLFCQSDGNPTGT